MDLLSGGIIFDKILKLGLVLAAGQCRVAVALPLTRGDRWFGVISGARGA